MSMCLRNRFGEGRSVREFNFKRKIEYERVLMPKIHDYRDFSLKNLVSSVYTLSFYL